MHIHWIQHVHFEGLGSIESWARKHGHSLSATRTYLKESFPPSEQFQWLVVMGGPMNIYEEDKYPWLTAEKEFLKGSIEEGKIVLGICLGAQLIADTLSSRVFAGRHKEIGWMPVRKTASAANSVLFKEFPREMDVFHWHGDTFNLPAECVHVAESVACLNQAFSFRDRVVGLQFHLEMTREGVETILDHCRDELVEAPFIQDAGKILSNRHKNEEGNREMDRLLDRLFSLHS